MSHGYDGRGPESQARNELQRLIRAGEDELPPNLGNILASVLKESSRNSVQSSIPVAVQTSKNAGPLSGDDIKEARQASTAFAPDLADCCRPRFCRGQQVAEEGALIPGSFTVWPCLIRVCFAPSPNGLGLIPPCTSCLIAPDPWCAGFIWPARHAMPWPPPWRPPGSVSLTLGKTD